MKFLLTIFGCCIMACSFAQRGIPVGAQLPLAQVPVHDPVMIKEKGIWYLFCTGNGITVWSSHNLKQWRKEAPVFAQAPQWALDTIPGFKGHIWAPDISYHNGLYYLYYSVSAFGKNTSAIGVATNKTLDSASADFKWTDHGRVIQSYPGITNWNAIDPNLVLDKQGDPYLAFGSFWAGIKLVKLTGDLLHRAESFTDIPTIASRFPAQPHAGEKPAKAGNNAIEAPFIFKRGKYFYLFASIDYCCQGEKSTYKMMVGRSRSLAGPYLDKDGKGLAAGGGSILLQGDSAWYGVGHNAVVRSRKKVLLVYHGYDAADKGISKLNIRQLAWDKAGWPKLVTQ